MNKVMSSHPYLADVHNKTRKELKLSRKIVRINVGMAQIGQKQEGMS